ncbi:hypothetical protein [Vagococcus fluvialis]|uniref:hypothetical protein n=1 Tax=Vagococcus fluvialis TaxID=2738 RepID=UPI001D09E909|nr:hypothetical protein [Vagococcus fluvialis]UDM79120.1 hypothetical protein K5K97_10430 [Vagococcus fluvialis]
MKQYRLDEFFSDPEFEGIITNRDRKYYNDNGTFKDRGKILGVLSNQYFDVSFEGRGKKLLLTIGDKNPDAPPLDGRVNNNFSDVDNQILKNFSAYLKEEIFDGRIQEGHSRTIMKWLFNSQVLGEHPHIFNTFKSVETGEFKDASKLIEQYYTDNLKVEVDMWVKEYYANRRIAHNVYERPKIKEIILNPLTQKFLISEYTMFISTTFKNVTKRIEFLEFERVMCLKYKSRNILVTDVPDIQLFFTENRLTYEISLYDDIVEAEQAEEIISKKAKENLTKTYFVLKPKEEKRIVKGDMLNQFDRRRKSLGIVGKDYYKSQEYQDFLFKEYNTKEAWTEYGIKSVDREKLDCQKIETINPLKVRNALLGKFEDKIIGQELFQEYYPILKEKCLFEASDLRELGEGVDYDILRLNQYGMDSVDYKVKKDGMFYLSLYAIAKILSGTEMDIFKYLDKKEEKIKNDILSNTKELNEFLLQRLEEPFVSQFKMIHAKIIQEYQEKEARLSLIDSNEIFEELLEQLKEEYRSVI